MEGAHRHTDPEHIESLRGATFEKALHVAAAQSHRREIVDRVTKEENGFSGLE
jgi:hypothetical protein